MDRRERVNDFQTAMSVALQSLQADMWTALPGIIQSYNSAQNTAEVQLAIKAQVQGQDYVWADVALPLLPDTVVVWPGGGGYSIRFPLAAGDEVLVVFGSRCIDAWWANGGVQPQQELRMHDLSDGFCIPRVWSKPNFLYQPGATFCSDNGSVSVTLDADSGKVSIKAPGGLWVNGVQVQVP